ncbi:MAG: MotA/TolQ/ExbB proton channel [Fibrobacteres bacterium]|nr:MotA/TolQ/ExbB proton channel [Fibrobacterota bacterium]
MKHPMESIARTKPASKSALAAAFIAALLFAAGPAKAQVSVNENAEKLEALKEELEKARQLRDKVIAKRWEDKRGDMDAREKFNQAYDDLKNQLETRNLEADRLHEEIQSLLKDAEEAEATAENAKIQFLSVAPLLRDRISEMSATVEKTFPAKVPERIQRFNLILKSADSKREAPAEILADLAAFYASELALTREISLEKRGFLRADKTPGEGALLRLGMAASAYRDDKTGAVGLLIKDGASGALNPYEWRENLPVEASTALSKGLERMEKGEAGSAAVSIPIDILPNQTQGKAYIVKEEKSFWKSLFHTVKTGGVFMWPLLIIPVVVLVLFFQKLFAVFRSRAADRFYAQAVENLSARPEESLKIAKNQPGSSVLKVIGAVAANRGKDRELAEKDVKEVLLFEVPRLERHLTTLSVMAAAAPLLGLLGTVSGLIAMFQVITQHGVNDPKLLAGGIGEALIATETGLLIAIPTLMGHNFLANRVDRLVSDMEFYGLKALNTLWPKG